MNILLDFLVKINHQNSHKVIQELLVGVLAILMLGGLSQSAVADLTITPTTNAGTIETQLTGENVTISNVTIDQGLVGNQTGVFSGGATGTTGPLLGIANGVVLVTGDVTSADGPNKFTSLTTGLELGPPSTLLGIIDQGVQYDTVTLEFKVVPTGNTLSLDYVFASEEYNEYVCTRFNDAVGIFVSGPGITGEVNIARIDQNSAQFSINQINRGTPGHISTSAAGCDLTNSQFFVNNIDNYNELNSANSPTSATIQSNYSNVEYDGLTKPLAATLSVQPNQTYTIKVVTADIGDAQWDGAVFLDLIRSYNLDYGDAPNSYSTSSINQAIQLPGPARHSVDKTPLVYLGSIPPDVEGNGIPATAPNAANGDDNTGDDEDVFNDTLTISSGITSHTISNIPVHNISGKTAELMGWIDFNQDGDFLDAGEQATVNVAANQTTANLSWSGFTSLTAGNTYARFRITTDTNLINSPSSDGLAIDGEVEDYQVAIAPYDYGDAPDSYGTNSTNNNSEGFGAHHAIVNTLKLGKNAPDAEADAQTPLDGTGDGVDEDGISTFPSLTTNNSSYTLTATVNNTTGSAANVYAWLDFDHDGKIDGDERATVSNGIGNGSITLDGNGKVPTGSNGTVTLRWNNLGGTGANIIDGNSYARIRLTTDNLSAASATTTRDSASVGNATNGEVEDYPIAIASAISPLASQLVINEVLYRGIGNTAIENDEFIELYNASNNSINLNGLKLFDGNLLAVGDPNAKDENFNGTKEYYTFGEDTSIESGNLTLQPGQYAVVWIGARNSGGSQIPGRFASGATFQAWLGQDPKLLNTGDDVWLYDANTKIIDYMAYGIGGSINTRPNASLNLWNSTYKDSLDGASAGQSISLTPNGIDGNSSACWEKTAIPTNNSDSASDRCTGFLNTIDTDIAFVGTNQRITSVGKNNNQLVQDYGDAPTGYEGNNSARHALSTNLYLGNTFPDNESTAQSSANANGDDTVATPNLDDEDGISSFPTLTSNTTSYSLTARVNNPSGLAAKVYAWIDFDRNQKFDQDERATVVNNSASGSLTLNWNNIGSTGANIINGSTSMRIRLTTSNLDQTTETTLRDDASIGSAANGEVEDYPIAIAQSSDPNLLLVKRITAINPGQSSEIQFNNFIDDPGTTNDNNSKWPDSDGNFRNSTNNYLRGEISVPQIKPGDEVEYTIYFLSNGDIAAKDVKICDVVPDHMTFVKNTYGVELGIGLGFDPTAIPLIPNLKLSNLLNDDQGDFFALNTTPPANLCKKVTPANTLINVNGTNNDNGVVVVTIPNLPKANTPGSPTDSYGFIRFRAKVK